MAYSGISIQSNGGSVSTAASDVQVLRNAGIQTLGIQIKPTKYKEFHKGISWEQALNKELEWAFEVVQACNDPELRKIKVVIRFNDLVSSDDSIYLEMNSEEWWETYTSVSLFFWDLVCQKFIGQDIYMFEIYSEPARIDNRVDSPRPIKSELESFYQVALNIVRVYNSDAYFLLSPGPFGKYNQYLHGFTPFNIVDTTQPQKLVYGFHMYVDHDYTHQGINNLNRPQFYPTLNNSFLTINSAFSGISAWSLQYGYPIYMGEFNAARWSPNAIDWVKNVIENAVMFDFHWSFFAFNPYFDAWNPYFDVDNLDAIDPSYWTIAYVGPNTLLWQFLLTKF